jgi:hypothetical protein
MSYDAIRERLARSIEERNVSSANDKLLIESVHQLTTLLESDLTQIKVALGHVARLLEPRAPTEPRKLAFAGLRNPRFDERIMIVQRCVSQPGARA